MKNIEELYESLKIPKGFYLCTRCNGTGIDMEAALENGLGVYDYVCPKCKGNKIIDWIENVVGVK